ncbi:MAG: 4-(cytidine 5'-diphospho)-2-C-methyl-D-erythritol kinase [Deltaproteobacteria bacterium]|nr:4-(cytidine 5'-diphospho)-2-C-methyl-D-erythritol kinase [Deltaproteobacteria bacterium]
MSAAPTQVERLAPAKVNLLLAVVGRCANGYHLLESVMAPLGFGDTVTVIVGAEAERQDNDAAHVGDGIFFTCDHVALSAEGNNLSVHAARAMRQYGPSDVPIAIHVTKRIPIGGGLGGGSSDAAAVLHALNHLWGLTLSPAQLGGIGVRLGADVPFFCWEGAAWVTGIGETVVPYEKFPNLPVLLVNPNIHISTASIFHSLDFHLTHEKGDAKVPPLVERFEDVTAILHNDLESVTVRRAPVIQEIKTRLEGFGAAALMSGSGPTVFGVFRTTRERDMAHTALQSGEWWCCATTMCGV